MAEKTNFYELLNRIYQREILLPDFQRKFVWSDEERQRKVVASVLARMPIGSILLLKSDPKEFKSKCIGSKIDLNTEDLNKEVEFLLDGQQRITVLTNVFSDTVHMISTRSSDLNSYSLKKRFFLKIPKWGKCIKDNDIWGEKALEFKYKCLLDKEPDLLTNQVVDHIYWEQFKTNVAKPYNPTNKYNMDLDSFCISSDTESYLIPLFLMVNPNVKNQSIARTYERIMTAIGKAITEEIVACYLEQEDKGKFLRSLQIQEDEVISILNGAVSIDSIEWKCDMWIKDLKKYLEECLSKMNLNMLEVEQTNRARAIDIYENLNRGGVSLSTFDLIMAKVAKVSKDNFYNRIVNNIQEEKVYKIDNIPERLFSYTKNMIEENAYNASVSMHALEKEDSISNVYINTFLNVLSLYCNNKDLQDEKISIESMKQDKILDLEPKDIDENCELVCRAIDRAFFFFQTRCGLRSIKEINYANILTLIAFLFTQDRWYENGSVIDLLEAWYWSAIFSGEFDRDQNVRFETNLKAMVKTLRGEKGIEWIETQREKVLNAKYFSERSFLLLENASVAERYPKRVLRYFISQFFLSQTYTDMFDNKKKICVFMEGSDELQLHHVIPLGSANNISDSTKKLRDKDDCLLNSPLNFVYILSSANLRISMKSIGEYQKLITAEAFSQLHFNACSNTSSEDEIKDILSARHTSTEGQIKARITSLLDNWKTTDEYLKSKED